MKCQRFKGENERARIEAVFRYLDPGGEGTVSKQEFCVVNQLWQEFELSVREFVSFLCRAFDNNLWVAWSFVDDNSNGELEEDEWLKAVECMEYFGPSKVVFALLDSSCDGIVSYDGFQVLEKYKPQCPSAGKLSASPSVIAPPRSPSYS